MINKTVYITRSSVFFPNEPIENEEMEQYLGMVGGKPSLCKNIVLRRNGIKKRYYALDKEGNVTHTNVEIAANAINGLFDDKITLNDIDVLACGTASPEQIMPSHGSMVHGALGGEKNIDVVSFAGSCCTGMQALKYAQMTILAGFAEKSVCSASERLSSWMRAKYFNAELNALQELEDKPILAF